MSQVQKRQDKYAAKSAEVLKNKVRNSITDLFKTTLDMVELKFGKDFDGYKDLRSKILRTGNNAIRELEDAVDNRFNIEIVPDVLTVNFKERQGND